MVKKKLCRYGNKNISHHNSLIKLNFRFHLSLKSTFNFRLIWRLTFEKSFTSNHVAKLNDA